MHDAVNAYDLKKIYSMCHGNNLSFVFFRNPRETYRNIVIQLSSEIHMFDAITDINSKMFVFAPFAVNSEFQILTIQPDLCISEQEIGTLEHGKLEQWKFPNKNEVHNELTETKKEEFTAQIEVLKKAIHDGSLQKVVLSRTKIQQGNSMQHAFELFDALCTTYPDAFVYILRIPGKAFWIGVSPEVLLQKHGNVYHTVSLAATQVFSDLSIRWDNKEIEEQLIVTQYIEQVLSAFQINDFKKQGPITERAGNLAHLKTSFDFVSSSPSFNVNRFISELHPTTSICGFPKDKAYAFIQKMERHKRAYYAGYLGMFDPSGDVSLYVNIRCMQLVKGSLVLYAGCGITGNSDAEKEWEETSNKTGTLLAVIEKMQTFTK